MTFACTQSTTACTRSDDADYLEEVVIVPGTTSPGSVQIQDGAAGAITIFTGGATSVADLKPFTVRIGIRASGAGWKVK